MMRICRYSLLLVSLHLFVCMAYYLFVTRRPPPVWAGSVTASAVLLVQYTWSFTVGFMLGPSRKRRKWYWLSLLLSFIPLRFVGMTAWVIRHLFGGTVALCFLAIAFSVLFLETFAGIWYGIICHCACKD